jgi:hypothetical protein
MGSRIVWSKELRRRQVIFLSVATTGERRCDIAVEHIVYIAERGAERSEIGTVDGEIFVVNMSYDKLRTELNALAWAHRAQSERRMN